MSKFFSAALLGVGLVGCAILLGACATEGTAPAASTSSQAVEQAQATTTSAVPAPTSSSTRPRRTTTTTATTTTTLPPITIGFAGDTSFTHGLHARDPLGDIAAELSAPDLMVVNLETTVAESDVGAAIDKTFTFKSPPVTADLLAAAGVDVAALANNHALDYGPDAVLRTIEILNAGGVASAGTGRDPDEAYTGIRLDVSGWDVAILSFSRVPCDSPEPGETYIDEVAWACPQFRETAAAAVMTAADADFTVVMVHWGIQRQVCPAEHQQILAAEWIDAGADAIVGSHPHVLQGVEQIDGAWVIHSTGNFAFPSARGDSSYSSLFVMTLTATQETLEAIPVRIQEGRPVRAEASRDGILNDLSRRSFGFTFDPSGQAVATPGSGHC